MITTSTTIAASRRVARLSRAGLLLTIEPNCPHLLGRLRTVEHVLLTDRQRGTHLRAEPRRLYQAATGDVDAVDSECITMAGMEPVVRHLLHEAGWKVVSSAESMSLPEPNLEALCGHGLPVDSEMLQLIQHHDRGLVRYGAPTRLATLIAQIAAAWPDLRIAIACRSKHLSKELVQTLSRRLAGDVALVHSDRIRQDGRRIAIGHYEALLGGCPDLNNRDLLLACGAAEIVSQRGLSVLQNTDCARLIGFLPLESQLAPYDADHVRACFGFHEACVPVHGHQQLHAEVVQETITGGKRLPEELAGTALHRQALWHNGMFNRRLSALARAIVSQDVRNLRKFRQVKKAIDGMRIERVAVLVNNLEHAIALAKRLQDWRVLPGPDYFAKGLSLSDRTRLDHAVQLPVETPTIVTAAGLRRLDPRDTDVLIRADVGGGLPSFAPDKLALPYGSNRKLLLVDFDDRRHHELGRLFRRRRQAYRASGWYRPGADPLTERVHGFLASRPNRKG